MQRKHKIFLLFALMLIVLSAKNLAACPAYGTQMPEQKKFFAGLEYNFVLERDMHNNQGRVKSPNQFFMLSYGLFDWLSIDLKGGSGKVTYKDSEFGDQQFSTSFAGAYGFRIRLWEKDNIKLVTGFQHISVHPKSVQIENRKYSVIVDEWQASCLASLRIKQLVPYLGAKYETYDLIRWINEASRKRYKSEDNWGLILGSDFWLNDRIKINLEYHFVDEKAISVSLGFSF